MRRLTPYELDLVAGGFGGSSYDWTFTLVAPDPPSPDPEPNDPDPDGGPTYGGGNGNGGDQDSRYNASMFMHYGGGAEFEAAIDYLAKSETGRMLLDWAKGSGVIIKVQPNSTDGFVKQEGARGAVTWDPNDALDVSKNGVAAYQSAAMGLLHELAHAYYYNVISIQPGAPTSDHAWIMPIETRAANELGEGTRSSASEGVTYYEESPTAANGPGN